MDIRDDKPPFILHVPMRELHCGMCGDMLHKDWHAPSDPPGYRGMAALIAHHRVCDAKEEWEANQ